MLLNRDQGNGFSPLFRFIKKYERNTSGINIPVSTSAHQDTEEYNRFSGNAPSQNSNEELINHNQANDPSHGSNYHRSTTGYPLIKRTIKDFFVSRAVNTEEVGFFSKCEDAADYVEAVVCKDNEINDNEMKQFDLADAGKVLIVKQNGIISAVGTKCTHYGAPLHTGALGNNRVRCPWHGACFNLTTGDIEDFPGLDSIPCYRATVENGEVKVLARRSQLEANKRIKDMVLKDPNNDASYVIIGGGPSGGVCSEVLRQEGFTGRIVLVCKEPTLPYDRIKCSKVWDATPESLQFRTKEFYDKYSIEVMTDVEATQVHTKDKTVSCSNGFSIKFDKLYIATGSDARKPNIPGSNLKNVVTVRTLADANKIHSILNPNVNVVCLGSSFISLEAAASCAKKAKSITVVGRDNVPLRPSFGEQIGKRILQLFEENGINMVMNSGIKRCIGTDVITAVELADGSEIPCDLCIMGTGTTLNTGFLKESGININANGSIDVDMCLRTNVQDIYAGGDIANAPVHAIGGKQAAIGHYQLAQYHGRIAAKNMAGNITELKTVPFFWTMLFGKSFRYSGYGMPHEIHIDGNIDELKFVAIHFDKDGLVIGMASCMRDPVVARFAEYQTQGKRLYKKDLVAKEFRLDEILQA